MNVIDIALHLDELGPCLGVTPWGDVHPHHHLEEAGGQGVTIGDPLVNEDPEGRVLWVSGVYRIVGGPQPAPCPIALHGPITPVEVHSDGVNVEPEGCEDLLW